MGMNLFPLPYAIEKGLDEENLDIF